MAATRTPILGMLLTLTLAGCPGERAHEEGAAPAGREPMPPGAEWLEGTDDERFARVARHLRGFDVAMVETGYRYIELYWAGEDANWPYARYQVEKIRTAIANGVERRPRRGSTARMIEPALNAVDDAAQAGSPEQFRAAFERLTATCNACHGAERVGFMQVQPPRERVSPITFGEGGARR